MFRRHLPLLGALACPGVVQAQAQWPTRPVRIVVTFPPGGSSDIVARVLAEHYSAAFNQRFIVDNRPGAGGTLAARHVAEQPADGYTWMLSNSAPIVNSPPLYRAPGYDPVTGFSHVAYIGSAPTVLVVNPTRVPATTLPEFTAWVRAQSAPPGFGSSGAGSVGHVLGEMYMRQSGTTLTHVPYRGSAPMLADLLGGSVPLAFDTLPQNVEHIRSGRLRGIVVSSRVRSPMAPDVPTTAEGGMPELVATNWMGMSAPAGLPAPIAARLQAATQAALATEVIQHRLAEHGVAPAAMTSAQFQEFVANDVRVVGGMIRALGISAE